MNLPRRAAVVGCGLGGMAAALALARRGVEVTLFEAFAEPKPLGSGLLLQATGLAALDGLGLGEAVRAAGAKVEKLEGHDARGRLVLRLEYSRWRPGAHGLGVHRGRLFQTLFQALGAAGVDLRAATPIEAIVDPANPRLIAADGAEHGPFELAVLADGSASRLRPLLRPRARAPLNPWGAMWGNAPDPDGRFDGVLRQVYRLAEAMVGVLPIGLGPDSSQGPQVSLFWSLPSADAPGFAAGDFARWREDLRTLWPEAGTLADRFTSAADLAPALYRDVSVGRWNAGACVLIGDAAHGTSPQLGQGANLALVDALELADSLTPATSVAVSLDRFQASRRAHTALYQIASRALTPMFQSHGRFWSALRDWVFTPISLLPGVRRLGAAVLTGAARFGPWPEVTRP